MAARTDRKSQHAAITRVAILDGAARAFASKGYEAATMADIAGEAGYSAPTLYNYFENKEAIVEALHGQLLSEYAALFDQPLPEALTFAQKLEILLLRKFDFEHRHSQAIAVLMQPRPGASKKMAESILQGFKLLMTRYAAWIEAAAQPEELHGWNPTDLAFFLWSIHHAVLARGHLLGHRDQETPAERARLVLHFILYGLGGPPTQTSDPSGE